MQRFALPPARSQEAMEAAVAHSFLYSRSFPFLPSSLPQITSTAIAIPPFSSSHCLNFSNFRPNDLKSQRLPPPPRSSTGQIQSNPSEDLAILLEVEGVLADVNRVANRQAFNSAFQKLGLDCANWTEPIYADLTRKTGGDEERMVTLFFNRVGWPSSLPTNEKETFVKSVLREKQKALEEFATSSNLSLRPGVENFIDDALKDGVPVVFLTAYSRYGDKLSRSIVEKLGHDRISIAKIVGKEEVERSLYGQLVLGKGVSSSLDEKLAKEAGKAVSAEKQRVAEEVASILKLSVDIDTSPSESLENTVATLRAGAEYAGLSVQSCMLIAGSQSGVVGAERIGMPCVVLRSSLTARAEFRKANAVMDGFGDADLTLSKLRSKR